MARRPVAYDGVRYGRKTRWYVVRAGTEGRDDNYRNLKEQQLLLNLSGDGGTEDLFEPVEAAAPGCRSRLRSRSVEAAEFSETAVHRLLNQS